MSRPLNVVESGYVLYSTTPTTLRRVGGGAICGTQWPEHSPTPAGMLLDLVPLTPAAHDAFSPEELDARIARHAARHADAPVCGCVCWCCGKRTTRTAGFHLMGWVSRKVWYSRRCALREVYCGECFAEWGWPTEEST